MIPPAVSVWKSGTTKKRLSGASPGITGWPWDSERNNTLYYHISPLVLENGINDGTIDLDLDGYDRELLVPDELEELQPDWYGFLDGSLGALTEVEHIIYFPDLPAESGTFTRYYKASRRSRR